MSGLVKTLISVNKKISSQLIESDYLKISHIPVCLTILGPTWRWDRSGHFFQYLPHNILNNCNDFWFWRKNPIVSKLCSNIPIFPLILVHVWKWKWFFWYVLQKVFKFWMSITLIKCNFLHTIFTPLFQQQEQDLMSIWHLLAQSLWYYSHRCQDLE